METPTTRFMRELEVDFRSATGLLDRSVYKIFYGQIHTAPILTLGINPGGDPLEISSDGTVIANGLKGSASASYYENNEHDILDRDWRENAGLRRLLYPLVAHDSVRFRNEVVKTNVAFRRSRRKMDIDITAAITESVPFLGRIIQRVSPRLVVLTGVFLEKFMGLFASSEQMLVPAERNPGTKHVVFAASRAILRLSKARALVVQVDHASQFSWTYTRYNVANRTLRLLEEAGA